MTVERKNDEKLHPEPLPPQGEGGEQGAFKVGGLLKPLLDAGLVDSVREVLDLFLDQHRVQSADLIEALDQPDLLRAADIAHTMISSAGGIGANDLATTCDRLECACRAGDSSSVEGLRAALRTEEERVFEGVRQLLSEDSSDS